MYLLGSRWMWGDSTDKATAIDIGNMFPELQGKPIRKVETELMYWRKSNAIHQWFVINVQGGTDDCNDYHVNRDQLQRLLDLCRAVVADREHAVELMPTANGFFFGDTNYSDRYFEDIADTAEKLDQLLQNRVLMDNWDIFYRASW